MKRGVLSRLVLVAVVIIGAALLFVIVHAGQQRAALARVLAREANDTLEAFLAEGPPIDEALQGAFWNWVKDVDPFPSQGTGTRDEAWFLRGDAAPPKLLLHQHEARRPEIERLSAFLATDRLVVSSRGWLRGELERGGGRPPGQAPLRSPQWTILMRAMRWFSIEVMLAADPEPALRDADRLGTAARPIGTPHDHRTWLHLRDVRDRAYLRRAFCGTGGSPALDDWLAEAPPAWHELATAHRADRLLYHRPVADDLCHGRLEAVRAYLVRSHHPLWKRLRNEAYLHLGAPRDAARRLDAARRVEAHARGDIPAHALAGLRGWREEAGPLFDTTYGDHAWRFLTVLHARAAHRMARLAVLALRHGEQVGALPEGEAAFRVWLGPRATLLDGGARDLRLVYERLTPERVRIALDPEGHVPEIVRARHGEEIRAKSLLGKPPGTAPLVFDAWAGGIEVQRPVP